METVVQIQEKERSESRSGVALGENQESGAGTTLPSLRSCPRQPPVWDSGSGCCRSNLNFSAGSRAHAWGAGRGALSPPPHRVTWPRRPGGSQGDSAPGAQPQPGARRPGPAGGAVLLVPKPPPARSPTFNVRSPHPIPSRGLGQGVPLPSFLRVGLRARGSCEIPLDLWASRGILSAHPHITQRGLQA